MDLMYFSKGYTDFFERLNDNNTRQWFDENRKWYELSVREPFKDMIEDLLPGIKNIDNEIIMESKDAMFRINRDLRFAQNMPPYKTHMAAGFSRGGRKSQFAGYYIQIGLNNIIIGGGLPFIEKEMLRKIRIEIGYNKREFQEIIDEPQFKSLFGFVLGENDNKLPKHFVDVYNENPLIANKQFYYGAMYNTESWIFRKDLGDHILKHFIAGTRFNQFLIKAISNFMSPNFRLLKSSITL